MGKEHVGSGCLPCWGGNTNKDPGPLDSTQPSLGSSPQKQTGSNSKPIPLV